MTANKSFEQLAALTIVEIDHFNTIFAQPVEPPGESSALAHYKRADAKLPYQATAIPARRKSGYHYQLAVAALATTAAKGVSLAVDARITLLDPPIAPSAQQFAFARKKRRADWDASLRKTQASFLDCNGEHFFVSIHKNNLNQRGGGLANR
jgi:hypothetical protein